MIYTNNMSAHAFSFFFSKHFKYLGDICTCACLYTVLNVTENKLILNNFYRTKRQSVYQPSPAIQLSITGHKLKEEKHFF